MRITVECNKITCKERWEINIEPERIIGNRVNGLYLCPKCGRYDSPYIYNKISD